MSPRTTTATWGTGSACLGKTMRPWRHGWHRRPRPPVEWRTAGDRATAGGVDVTLHAGSADGTAVPEALDSLALKMTPHFDVPFDQVRSGKGAGEEPRVP
ncbi:hypothetical protein JL100_015230 [Skermanella mucosa]|uniref:hypothetical protein n=1 Tax=Skermanella mucosa TaxID=1789672 RepID=UPI00192A701B|nr:hypothetical protein [Skermanella mucosa]UEM18473.1 hypothetical protein JL100_015230 [Skermanella mucosa]